MRVWSLSFFASLLCDAKSFDVIGGYAMFTNVNLPAPIGVLLFLGAGLVIALTCLLLVYALVRKKNVIRKFAFLTLAMVAGAYLALMLIFSWSSSDRVLLRGQEKHFCEIDCHLAYSVLDVKQTKSLGNPPQTLNASGIFYLVTVRTRFDETTISPRRGSGPLSPNPRLLTVIDSNGTRYSPSAAAQTALQQSTGSGMPITTALRPGESYSTTVVFDLPETIQHPVLLINERDWITHFVIGHENSVAHKKTTFQI